MGWSAAAAADAAHIFSGVGGPIPVRAPPGEGGCLGLGAWLIGIGGLPVGNGVLSPPYRSWRFKGLGDLKI